MTSVLPASVHAQFTEDRRFELGTRIQRVKDFRLPPLPSFNSAPCDRHAVLHADCMRCGVEFRQHQRVGIAWLYAVRKGLIADSVGTGKTILAAGLLSLLHETGELGSARALVVTRSGTPLMQWQQQLRRLLPQLGVSAVVGTRAQRVEAYLRPWMISLIGYHMVQRDLEDLLEFPIRTLIVDDVDALRHFETKTAYCIKRLARDCHRVAILSGTPLQKRLHELHSVLEPIGGREIFGSESNFRHRYVREERVNIAVGTGTKRKVRSINKVVGYRNIDEFTRLVKPLALRRTAADIDDVSLPAVIPQNIFLDLYPAQQVKYRELRAGVLKIIKKDGNRVRRTVASSQFLYGAMLCSGLATLGETDAPRTSIKLDWLEEKLVDGDLSEEKVVVFMNFKNSIRVMKARLDRAGVGNAIIWGEEPNAAVRFAAQERFWQDPSCRVLMGTTAIEQSLNLQVARHLVNVDTIMNAARMVQLSGRIQRVGSKFSSVYVHNLLTNGTQEEGYLPVLEREQALQDAIWEEKSELFQALSPLALLTLIGKSTV